MWQHMQTEMLRKWSWQETKIREFMYRDKTNVEHKMYDYTYNNWNHRNGKKKNA